MASAALVANLEQCPLCAEGLEGCCLPDAALTCPFCPLPIKTSITALENVGIANSIAILVLSLPVFSLALLFCHK